MLETALCMKLTHSFHHNFFGVISTSSGYLASRRASWAPQLPFSFPSGSFPLCILAGVITPLKYRSFIYALFVALQTAIHGRPFWGIFLLKILAWVDKRKIDWKCWRKKEVDLFKTLPEIYTEPNLTFTLKEVAKVYKWACRKALMWSSLVNLKLHPNVLCNTKGSWLDIKYND